ncbi:stage II sporulation protein M [Natrialbaceae archaeon GCM10025810]|uniref:stage II sporulation protein M n=1 Tax=Halovalidus salilacus TaxID=3075124 RepID=UPI0036202EE5
MTLSDALRASLRTLRHRPSDLLPWFLLGAAVPAITRVIAFAGVAVLYLYLRTTGRFAAVQRGLDDLEEPPPETAEPEVATAWAESALEAVEPVVTATTVSVIVLTVVAMIAATVALSAVATATQLSACHGTLRGERGLLAGLRGARRWLSMLGLFVLEFLLWAGSAIAFGLVTLLLAVIGTVSTGSEGTAVFALAGAGLLWFVLMLTVRAVFSFAPVAVVVDCVGVGDSLRSSAGFIRRRPGGALGYFLLVIVATVAFGGFTAVSVQYFPLSPQSVVGLASVLVVVPFLELVKTAVFADYRDTVSLTSSRPTGAAVGREGDRATVDGANADSDAASSVGRDARATEHRSSASGLERGEDGDRIGTLESDARSESGDGSDRDRTGFEPQRSPSVREQLVGGIRRGLGELVAFVRATPGAHAVAVLALLVGFAQGWLLAEPFVGEIDTSIAERIEGQLPYVATIEYFTNNWLVALITAYAGVALVVPALASLWFNGLLLGAVGRLEVEPLQLLAFVAPHGIVEIPAIVVAGAVGAHLGWRTLEAFRGNRSLEALADDLERSFWVLVGIGVLLAIAAVIEGFVSPYYFRPLF